MSIYDVIVLGSGVSGATAAAAVALEGCDVLLLESRKPPAREKVVDWISAQGRRITDALAASGEEVFGDPIKEADFFSGDLTKSIRPQVASHSAYVIDCHQLTRSLVQRFKAAGGRVLDGVSAGSVTSGEDSVTVGLEDGCHHSGRLLLIADDDGAELAGRVGLSPRNVGSGGSWSVQAHQVLKGSEPPGHVDFFLGVGGANGFAWRLSKGNVTALTLAGQPTAAAAESEFERLCERMRDHGRLPDQWRPKPSSRRTSWVPAGLALDMETHVAKRTLCVGQTGGFVASYTNERVFPGMWSAELAAKVVGRALASEHVQDHLREFDSLWRMEMADYLRTPHADANSILPLVFSNQQMANKMLESILLGRNF